MFKIAKPIAIGDIQLHKVYQKNFNKELENTP